MSPSRLILIWRKKKLTSLNEILDLKNSKEEFKENV